MTPVDLSRIRMHAAETVTDRMSRQRLIAIIKRQRAWIRALIAEAASLERRAADLAAERDAHRNKVAEYAKRLEREWSPPREPK